MKYIGASLIVSTVDLLSNGEATTIKQDQAQVSHAPKIFHEDAHVNWNNTALAIYNLIRGMTPFPGAWTLLDGLELKILKAKLSDVQSNHYPGTAFHQNKNLIVQTGEGTIELLEVQLAGKRKMNVRDFLNGYSIKDWSLT
jgi:methionyl-tRNA formyltransferase